MTKALAGLGHQITFILPQAEETYAPFLDLVPAFGIPFSDADPQDGETEILHRLTVRPIPSLLTPYLDMGRYRDLYLSERGRFSDSAPVYGHNLIAEVTRYGRAAGAVARRFSFDVIHAHDWMTVPAACSPVGSAGNLLSCMSTPSNTIGAAKTSTRRSLRSKRKGFSRPIGSSP